MCIRDRYQRRVRGRNTVLTMADGAAAERFIPLTQTVKDATEEPRSPRAWSQWSLVKLLVLPGAGSAIHQPWWRRAIALWLWPVWMVGCSVGSEIIATQVGDVISKFYVAVTDKSHDQFMAALVNAAWVIGPLAVLKGLLLWLIEVVALIWRWRLWDELHASYMCPQKLPFFQLKAYQPGVDNPDQRLTQDLTLYTQNLATVVANGIVKPGQVVYYTWILLDTFGIVIPAVCYAYFVVGTVVTTLLARRVVPWVVSQEKKEGDLRYGETLVRTNAEGIAFHVGGEYESFRQTNFQAECLANQWELSKTRLPLYLCNQVMDYLGSIVTYCSVGALLISASYSIEQRPGVLARGSYLSLYLINAFSTSWELFKNGCDAWALGRVRIPPLARPHPTPAARE
eukprot:TRINITY_DN6196_c0_g1_i1.p1 TRINITY_DN6196_c0_g1~~TRINITY_DN6196_c0_g1_i1.p1  ORF type:complete len:398 (+),score=78.13 TRINITY_DN6196_c0_g1_i1:163-1356(+)